ncbi:unnamed protein product [Soboliphyme baturini]|uniref:TPR_REGION domain-containing protein n=1 Tax=Soboliphyme baturini TaxID=241478 RepID=A0A183IN38_9BILA|nr:unnamed protein product [Soboliphyme baturini]
MTSEVIALWKQCTEANRIIVVDGDQSAMAVNLAFANFSLGRFEQSLSILERFVNEQTDGNIVVMLNAALLGATVCLFLLRIWMCSYLNALQQYKANEIKSACTTIVSMSEELKHCRASHGLNDFDCITSNTLGCFYSAMNKPNLAATYFQRSLGFS